MTNLKIKRSYDYLLSNSDKITSSAYSWIILCLYQKTDKHLIAKCTHQQLAIESSANIKTVKKWIKKATEDGLIEIISKNSFKLIDLKGGK